MREDDLGHHVDALDHQRDVAGDLPAPHLVVAAPPEAGVVNLEAVHPLNALLEAAHHLNVPTETVPHPSGPLEVVLHLNDKVHGHPQVRASQVKPRQSLKASLNLSVLLLVKRDRLRVQVGHLHVRSREVDQVAGHHLHQVVRGLDQAPDQAPDQVLAPGRDQGPTVINKLVIYILVCNNHYYQPNYLTFDFSHNYFFGTLH